MKAFKWGIVAGALLAAVSQADDLNARLKAYKAKMDVSAVKRLAELDEQRNRTLAEIKRFKRAKQPAQVSTLENSLKRTDRDIEFVKSGLNFIILDVDNAKTGDIGWLDSTVRVIQVIDNDEALINYDRTTLWMEGFDTSDIADNQRLRPAILFEVVGTKSYMSVAGAKKTARHIRLVSWSDWKKIGGSVPR